MSTFGNNQGQYFRTVFIRHRRTLKLQRTSESKPTPVPTKIIETYQRRRPRPLKKPVHTMVIFEVCTEGTVARTAETIPDAINPGFTLREALLNSSEFCGEKAVYRA